MAGDATDLSHNDSVAGLTARLETARQELMDAVAGLDEEGFRARPDASAWTAAEVLAHVLSAERTLSDRAQRALAGEDVTLTPRTDQERSADAKKSAQRMPIPQIVHAMLAQRRDTLRVLDGAHVDGLALPVRHPERGELTVAWLFDHIADHDLDHAAQVREQRERTAALKA